MRWQDNCSAVDMVLEAVRMDSACIIMKEGPQPEKYADLICENIRKAGRAGIKLVSCHWNMISMRRVAWQRCQKRGESMTIYHNRLRLAAFCS